MPVLQLDGRTLEGGGQLLRSSLCLSALTGQAIQLNDIRGKRSGGGGLKAQHLACVNWLASVCDARVEGAELKSKKLTFRPQPGHPSTTAYENSVDDAGTEVLKAVLDIGSPGSVGLALQAALPFILFSSQKRTTGTDILESQAIPVELTINGGTNVSGSPSIEYIDQVLIPVLAMLGFPEIHVRLHDRAWSRGPSELGRVSFTVQPLQPGTTLPGFTIPSRSKAEVKANAFNDLQATILATPDLFQHFRTVLTSALDYHFPGHKQQVPKIECIDSHHSNRLYLILVATVIHEGKEYKVASDSLYEKKIKIPERAATEMAELAVAHLADELHSGAIVDSYMRDQLVIFQALAEGKSSVHGGIERDGDPKPASLHARTAEWVVGEVLGSRIEEGHGRGVGFKAGSARQRRPINSGEDEVDQIAAKLEKTTIEET